jgi:hypothetical protein
MMKGKMRWALHERGGTRISGAKFEAKRLHFRGRHRCEETIETELKEMGMKDWRLSQRRFLECVAVQSGR